MSATMTPATQHALPTRKIDIGFNENTLALLGAAVLLLGAVLWTVRGPLTEKTDFSVTYVGAWMVHNGQGSTVYDLGEQRKVRDSLFAHPNPLIYEHPPFEALLLAPLAALPYRTAYLIWGLANALIWLVLPYIVRPYAPVPNDTLGYLTLWFLFTPLGVTLYQGQSSLLLLLLYLITFINLKRGSDVTAGLCLGLGLFKFQFVLPFVLIFFLRRKWRFLAGFLLTATVLGLLSLIAVGWQGVLRYIQLLLKVGSNPGNLSYGSAPDMGTLQGLIYAILGHRVSAGVVNSIVAAISMVLILFTAWCWRQRDRRRADTSFDLMFAGALAVSLVTGLHMHTHDFSPLLLALFLVAAHFPGRDRLALRLALGITLVLFWIPPLYFALVAWHGLYLMSPVLIVFALSALQLARSATEGRLTGEARVLPQ
jgi:hypothetical protein